MIGLVPSPIVVKAFCSIIIGLDLRIGWMDVSVVLVVDERMDHAHNRSRRHPQPGNDLPQSRISLDALGHLGKPGLQPRLVAHAPHIPHEHLLPLLRPSRESALVAAISNLIRQLAQLLVVLDHLRQREERGERLIERVREPFHGLGGVNLGRGEHLFLVRGALMGHEGEAHSRTDREDDEAHERETRMTTKRRQVRLGRDPEGHARGGETLRNGRAVRGACSAILLDGIALAFSSFFSVLLVAKGHEIIIVKDLCVASREETRPDIRSLLDAAAIDRVGETGRAVGRDDAVHAGSAVLTAR
mmetsp:Transcript_6850/g.15141  ORF Transcript_6850/g.15141 Transcript_6850/m.15141 type:complete len:302 (-) Transcript_6850:64-969(-)